MWNTIATNLPQYKSYPRIVGETGGKDFVFAHPSADVEALAVALVRGSFEYQGQKCSAASRGYIPKSLWPAVKERVVAEVEAIRMGSPVDFRNFMAAVIDEASFDNTMGYIDFARKSNEAQIVVGGSGDKATGYFVEPTVVLTSNPHFKLMEEEIFAPVLTIFVYDDRGLRGDARAVRHDQPVRAHRRDLRPRPRGHRAAWRRRCGTRPATSTSTTSRPAPSSASSRSAARAPPAPTTRRAPPPT